MISKRRFASLRRAILMAAAISLSSLSLAAEWPVKTIRIVVGAPAGGAADTLSRLLADALSQSLGQPVIVDNKPGASGLIGTNDLISSPADGYTFMLFQRGIVTEIPQAMKVNFDPNKDIKPLVQVSRQGLLLVGNPSVPAKTVPELIKYMRAHPSQLTCASAGVGLRGHTTAIQFSQIAQADMTVVGYKGSPPALVDVVGGHVNLMVDGPLTSLPLIQNAKIRAYATTYPTRMTALPDVPTFAELGYPQLSEVSWFALWTRPGVPQPIQDKVRNAVLQFLQQPKVKTKLAEMGLEPGLPLTSQEMTSDMQEASGRHAAVLKSINYKMQ